MKIVPIFAWYDLWVGAYWDAAKRRLYVFPVPMLGFYIQFRIVADTRKRYLVVVADAVWDLEDKTNTLIEKGYVLAGPPIAIKVQPDRFRNAYYQFCQALVLKK